MTADSPVTQKDSAKTYKEKSEAKLMEIGVRTQRQQIVERVMKVVEDSIDTTGGWSADDIEQAIIDEVKALQLQLVNAVDWGKDGLKNYTKK